MTDLLEVRDRPPRACADVWWERQLCIGFFIDWLDSRPEHAARDSVELAKARSGDVIARAAAVITGRLEPQWLELDGGAHHPTDYNCFYHAKIAGHLQSDELPLAGDMYRRLHELVPECMSALVNLAELARRAGREREAVDRLHVALALADGAPASRYGVANGSWRMEIRCAVARLARESGAGDELLEASRRQHLPELVALMRGFEPWQDVAVAAHQAFAVASAEQRILLHAAMNLASIPAPPPAAHSRYDAITAVHALVRQHSSPPLMSAGKPGRVGSAILWLVKRLLRP